MFLSIIIPVYNVEQYISQCLDSILNSNFQDYEIILVIGESEDSSNYICREYERKFKNIRVICQTGKGLSNARNCGLDVSVGEYVMYVDGDDYIDTVAFDKTIEKFLKIRKKQYDVLISDFNLVNIEGNVYDTRHQIQDTEEIIESYDYLKCFLKKRKNYWNVWRYIYKHEFLKINNLLSKENYKSEDIDYSTKVLLLMKSCCFYHNPYYCYRVRRSGSLVNVITMQNLDDLLDILSNSIDQVNRSVTFCWKDRLIKKLQWEYFFSMLLLGDIPEQYESAQQKIENYIALLKINGRYNFLYVVVKIFGVRQCGAMLRFLRTVRRTILKLR